KDRLASYLSWYNDRRPHWALKYQTPAAYLAQQTEGQP
ncbi:transposase, partial [Candidatus Gottesmanbacteria bacterium]|nr:transposase [Candidatus Gottesmanbacteria bacterium]MBI3577767.1 transposase [Candidatus Gottesmanbacteria bacterium]